MQRQHLPTLDGGSPLGLAARAFARHLRAEGRSAETIRAYGVAVRQFAGWLAAHGREPTLADITRGDVEGWLADLTEHSGLAPATRHLRYRGLQRFLDWAVDEEEIADSPMAKIKPPPVPVQPPAILGDDALRRLLKATEGRDFEARRDHAILSVLIDTGCRLGELAGLRLDLEDPRENDVDLDGGTLRVTGKGGRDRLLYLGARAARALDRYVRVRQAQPAAGRRELWISHRGPLSDSGIRQAIQRRARAAGIGHVFPHQFRHDFAHRWRLRGGDPTDLMAITGWRNPAMLHRYGASAAAERARASHRRLGPLDQL